MTPKEFEKRVNSGDDDATELSKLIYLNEIMIDMFESLSIEIVKKQKKLGMHRFNDKKLSSNLLKSAKALASYQRSYIQGDSIAEFFGDVSDDVQAIIQSSVFLNGTCRCRVNEYALMLGDLEDNVKSIEIKIIYDED